MEQEALPSVIARTYEAAGQCSSCLGTEFDTQHGRGQVYWWHAMGAGMKFKDGEEGARIDQPIQCVRCLTKHGVWMELPPVSSRNMGDGGTGRVRASD